MIFDNVPDAKEVVQALEKAYKEGFAALPSGNYMDIERALCKLTQRLFVDNIDTGLFVYKDMVYSRMSNDYISYRGKLDRLKVRLIPM